MYQLKFLISYNKKALDKFWESLRCVDSSKKAYHDVKFNTRSNAINQTWIATKIGLFQYDRVTCLIKYAELDELGWLKYGQN